MEQKKILIIDDDPDVLLAARIFLKSRGYLVTVSDRPENLPGILEKESFDVILLDMNFTGIETSGREGLYWLKRILKIRPDSSVILITAFGDVELAVKAVKEGASNFILKPWNNEKLAAAIMMALPESPQEGQKQSSGGFHGMIGKSESMVKIYSMIRKVAGTEANILILGENGTGKELVARAIHEESRRKGKTFLSADMGTLPENLFAAEMFGYKKGAFTDAKEDRAGRFVKAKEGTLFLDEIGNLGYESQIRLLRALEERKVTPLGCSESVSVDIRLVCATNMPLYQMVEDNRFRRDLLYRINTIELRLPPLRERREDIPLLAARFVREFSEIYDREFSPLSQETESMLQNHSWPGNIRELRHAVERAVLLSEDKELQFSSLTPPAAVQVDSATDNGGSLLTVERQALLKTLEETNYNITHAAEKLGLTRTSLYRRLKKHDIKTT